MGWTNRSPGYVRGWRVARGQMAILLLSRTVARSSAGLSQVACAVALLLALTVSSRARARRRRRVPRERSLERNDHPLTASTTPSCCARGVAIVARIHGSVGGATLESRSRLCPLASAARLVLSLRSSHCLWETPKVEHALSQDFVRVARAKGLSERAVIMRHAMRDALNPLITLFGYSFGSVVSGSVIVETVLGWSGLGSLSVKAVLTRDVPLLMGVVMVTATAVLIGNLLADIMLRLTTRACDTNTPHAGERIARSTCPLRAESNAEQSTPPRSPDINPRRCRRRSHRRYRQRRRKASGSASTRQRRRGAGVRVAVWRGVGSFSQTEHRLDVLYRAACANFIAPYDASVQSRREPLAPPTAPRFRDTEAAGTRARSSTTRITDQLARTYTEDQEARVPLTLFRAAVLTTFGLFTTDDTCSESAPSTTNSESPSGTNAPIGNSDAQRVYLLGTDEFGRDRLSRLLMASRFSLAVGPLGTLLAGVLGVLLGCISGYAGRRLDALLMRAADAMLALPELV